MVNKILIVEDDNGLQKYLKELFASNGYSISLATDGVFALNSINKLPPDLVILDLGLPNMAGEDVLVEIRKKWPGLPVIILTAKDSVSDKVQGLNIGADDYMTKPFSADELLARVKARLRQRSPSSPILQVEDLELNSETFEVKRSGNAILLTPQEFKLLEYLMQNKYRILTREMILSRVWAYSQEIETRVVDVYMGYLRKKIDKGFSKKLIQTVRGFGYMVKG